MKKLYTFRTHLYPFTHPLCTCYVLSNLNYFKLAIKDFQNLVPKNLLSPQTSVSRSILGFSFRGSTSSCVIVWSQKIMVRSVFHTQLFVSMTIPSSRTLFLSFIYILEVITVNILYICCVD